jgi:glycosyltransferase involved in cell wall biosynthesis
MDIPELLRASRATILCSGQEGLPLAVLEAQAMGVPVIGTDVRGTRDLIGSGGGRIVPLGNCAALAEAIDWMADHPQEASVMGQTGLEAAQRYDASVIAQDYMRLYTRCVGGMACIGD